MGVFLGFDEAVHLGELFVSGAGGTRSEIWVFDAAYEDHVAPLA
jgi:hypothetical protein